MTGRRPGALQRYTGDAASCRCQKCRDACRVKPGWFDHGESEKAAALLDMDLPTFFANYLGVDWWVESPADVLVLSPALTTMEPGGMFPSSPRGRCVFLDEHDRCLIHEAKPRECREYVHTDGGDAIDARVEAIVGKWRAHQAQIAELLGGAAP